MKERGKKENFKLIVIIILLLILISSILFLVLSDQLKTTGRVTEISKTYNILAIGDSNTVGVGNPVGCLTNCDGYRKKLIELLTNAGYKVNFVGSKSDGNFQDKQHEGTSGIGIAGTRQKINNGIIEKTNPDIILIMIGANDMWVSVQPVSSRGPISNQKAEYWVSELRGLLNDIIQRKPNAKIIIAKPTTPSNSQTPLKVFRNGIETITSELNSQGKDISVIDCSGASNDGVHFTPNGYNTLAQRWFNEIDNFLKKQTSDNVQMTSDSNDNLLSEITQYPIKADTNSGTIGNILSNRESSYSCSKTNFNGAWKKSTDTSSGKIILEFQTPVYPKKAIVYGIDSWFTKLEAWNGTDWEIIWMGESSNCITEMNVKQIDFKSNKYRITSPIGKFGGIYAVKIIGNKDEVYNFPSCKSTGTKCEVGEVCTTSWKNSNDTSMCCADSCEYRFYIFTLDMSPGFSSLDAVRVAKELNMNYYRFLNHRWYHSETNDDASEWQEVIDFYEKTENSNINHFLAFNSRMSFGPQYRDSLPLINTYQNIKATYGDDASNYGYLDIYKNVLPILKEGSELLIFLVGYSRNFNGWGSAFNTYFGEKNELGKYVVWADFGYSIPCVVNNPNLWEIANYNAHKPANKVIIGLYTSSYTPYYCINLRKMTSGWDPNDVSKQRVFWRDGLKAGAGGIYFWNPWMFSTNGRNFDYYNWKGQVWPKVSPSSSRDWTPEGVVVSNTVDLAKKEIPDLCPYCSFCGEDKIYMEDGFHGASCCYENEIALGNDCFKKDVKYQWAKNSDKNNVIGTPSDKFTCYGNIDPQSMWTLSTTAKIPESSIVLDYEESVSPNALVLYGSYMVIDKIEAWDGSSWKVLWNGVNKGYCISTINFTEQSFETNKIRIHIPSKDLGDIYKFTRSGIDAVLMISDSPKKICSEEDWDYSLGECTNGNQLKTWVKINECYQGVEHQDIEIVSCSVTAPEVISEPDLENDSDGDGVVNVLDQCPNTPRGMNVSQSGCIIPNWGDYRKIYSQTKINGIVENLQISNSNASVLFKNIVKVERAEGNLDIENNVILENKKVTIKSHEIPELNKTAIITFKNINLNEPIILMDGENCSECKIINYRNNILEVEVPHFTTYELIEKKDYENMTTSEQTPEAENNESSDTDNDEKPEPDVLLPTSDFIEDNIKNNPLEKDQEIMEFKDDDKDSGDNKNNKWIYYILIIVLILIVIGILIWIFLKKKKENSEKNGQLDNSTFKPDNPTQKQQVMPMQRRVLRPLDRRGFESRNFRRNPNFRPRQNFRL